VMINKREQKKGLETRGKTKNEAVAEKVSRGGWDSFNPRRSGNI